MMVLIACLGIAACGSDAPATSDESDPSTSTEVVASSSTDAATATVATDDRPIGTWTFVSGLSGSQPIEPVPTQPITLTLGDDGNFTGWDGCNEYESEVDWGDEGLRLEWLSKNDAPCDEPESAEPADLYRGVLFRTTDVEMDADQLVLTGAGGELRFERT